MEPMFRRFAFVLLVLAAAAVACAAPITVGTATPATDLVSTAVAQTLQAATDAAPAVIPTRTSAAATEAVTLPTEAPATRTPLPVTLMRVAYVDSARNLFLWVEGGGVVPLAATGDVTLARISPDGEQVAYVRGADMFPASLWVVQRDGSGARELMSAADLNAAAAVTDALGNIPYQVEWVPGRTHLLAVSTRPVFDGLGLMLNEDLILVDTLSGVRTALLAPGMGGRFVFSRDGNQIALVKTDRIDLVNLDGSNRRDAVLDYTPVVTYSEYAYYANPLWSADGGSLRVAIPPAKALDDPSQPATLWRISTDGSPAALLGSVMVAPLTSLVFSPDLNRIAYLTSSGAGSFDLYIAAADGSGASRYTNTAGRFIAWLPTSDRFVYYDNGADSPLLGTVEAMSVSLTDAAVVTDVKFLPDGRVVFLARNGGNWELRLAAPATPSAVIAAFPAGSILPSFDPLR
jgi:hypothetical protein